MNVNSRISILVATGILISSALGLGTSCVWDPYNSETITVGSPLTVNASPGDPAPDDQGQCACDSNDNPVDWAPTGNWSVSYGGDADSSGVVDTSIGDEWTVEANIQFEYSCPETGETKMVDDPSNPWTKQYTAQSYVIDGPSSLDHDTSGSYTAQSADGSPVNVTSWDAGDGVVTGSGSTVDISWSVPGQKSVTANIENEGTVTRSVEVMGTIEASITTPSDPAIVSVGEAVTFEAADPTGGDGNYIYEWSFENGQAPAGGSDEKKVEGVKFQAEALGKENEAKVIVRDGSGNSGEATIKAVVAKVTISEVDPTSLTISNDPSFYTIPNNPEWAEFTILIEPSTHESQIRSDVTMTIDKADPNTNDKGIIHSAEFESSGDPIAYNAKEETREMKLQNDNNLTSQKVTLHLKLADLVVDSREVNVLAAFEYLKSEVSDYDEAIIYDNEKYSLQYSATYNPNCEDSGRTHNLTLVTELGPDGMRSENNCASTLIHEQVHFNQGRPMLTRMVWGQMAWDEQIVNLITKPYILEYAYGELEAYYTELARRSHTAISQGEIHFITSTISKFEGIIEAVE